MNERIDRIRVQIAGKEFNVVGGKFQEMLAVIKQINGRRFVSDLKVWQLPGTAAEIQQRLDPGGYRLEGEVVATPGPSAQQPPAPRVAAPDRIRVLVAGQQLTVTGGSFQDMLAAVKRLPGRRFDGNTKMWEISGEVAFVKDTVEAAGFQLEGAENISLPPVAPPKAAPLTAEKQNNASSADEPPLFDDDYVPEPPHWEDDDRAFPFSEDDPGFDFAESIPTDHEPFPWDKSPLEPLPAATSSAKSGDDRIRLRLGELSLAMTGGSFHGMLTVIKNIPGRRFNAAEKVWELPANVGLETVQQQVRTAGFVLVQEK